VVRAFKLEPRRIFELFNIERTTMTNTTMADEAKQALFTDETMTLYAFRAFVCEAAKRERGLAHIVLSAPYCMVEYLNSPKGLVVLAHHNTDEQQVDGIHPNTISERTARNTRNIVEPLKGPRGAAPTYNVHYMTRRSQGPLVQEAFGRMVHGGDDEALSVSSEANFNRIEIYNTKFGPVIGAVESSDRVCVIRPEHMQIEKLSYEVAA